MKSILILITDKIMDAWATELANIVKPIGVLRVVRSREFSLDTVPPGCELIIIDAAVKAANGLLSQFNTPHPRYRVIVMTASPKWESARAAFEAGAMDYISKNLPPAEVLRSIQAVLKKPVLPPVRSDRRQFAASNFSFGKLLQA
jgi:DNA-binding NtrC family response regulator